MFRVSFCEWIRSLTAKSSSGRLSLVHPKLQQASAYYLVLMVYNKFQQWMDATMTSNFDVEHQVLLEWSVLRTQGDLCLT